MRFVAMCRYQRLPIKRSIKASDRPLRQPRKPNRYRVAISASEGTGIGIVRLTRLTRRDRETAAGQQRMRRVLPRPISTSRVCFLAYLVRRLFTNYFERARCLLPHGAEKNRGIPLDFRSAMGFSTPEVPELGPESRRKGLSAKQQCNLHFLVGKLKRSEVRILCTSYHRGETR